MTMLKGVLFDMDGVLVDTEKYIALASVEMFREKGMEVKTSDFIPFTGMGEIRYLEGVAEKMKNADWFAVNLAHAPEEVLLW